MLYFKSSRELAKTRRSSTIAAQDMVHVMGRDTDSERTMDFAMEAYAASEMFGAVASILAQAKPEQFGYDIAALEMLRSDVDRVKLFVETLVSFIKPADCERIMSLLPTIEV